MKVIIPGLLIAITAMIFAFTPKLNSSVENPSAKAPEQGIQFVEANWNNVVAEAKKQNKLIFLDAYAT